MMTTPPPTAASPSATTPRAIAPRCCASTRASSSRLARFGVVAARLRVVISPALSSRLRRRHRRDDESSGAHRVARWAVAVRAAAAAAAPDDNAAGGGGEDAGGGYGARRKAEKTEDAERWIKLVDGRKLQRKNCTAEEIREYEQERYFKRKRERGQQRGGGGGGGGRVRGGADRDGGQGDYWRGGRQLDRGRGGGGGRGGAGSRAGAGGGAGAGAGSGGRRDQNPKLPPPSAAGRKRIETSKVANVKILAAETIDDVLNLIDENVGDLRAPAFTPINYSTVFHRLGRLNKANRPNAKQRRYLEKRGAATTGPGATAYVPLARDARFVKLQIALASELRLHRENPPPLESGHGIFGVRECSSILWGLANCGCTLQSLTESPHAPEMLPTLLQIMQDFESSAWQCQARSISHWFPYDPVRVVNVVS